MLEVMCNKTAEKLKLFFLLDATERRVRYIQAGISLYLGAVCILTRPIIPRVIILAEMAILIFALFITKNTIIELKWRMHDEALAFHEASAKIYDDMMNRRCKRN